MSKLSTAIRYNPLAQRNPHLVDLTDTCGSGDNADFLAEVAKRLSAQAQATQAARSKVDARGTVTIGLIGEYGPLGYSIRRAQELIRVDRTPSAWSHAFLFLDGFTDDARRNRDAAQAPRLLESTLEPASALNHFVYRNGVGVRRFADYVNSNFDLLAAHSVPNIAVICIGVTDDERAAIQERAQNPEVDQIGYDLPGLLGTWYAFVVNRAACPNPLAEGAAVYCSAYVQLAYDAAGIELSPGAHERNIAPEHLWQSASYLHGTFELMDDTGALHPRFVGGFYCIRDAACLMAPIGTHLPRTLGDLLAR